MPGDKLTEALNLERNGNGPIKLVAIHGLGSAASAWKLLQSKLDKNFELITIDLPGHGKSDLRATSDMTPEILSHIVRNSLLGAGIERFHIVSNSLGGWISLELAASFPNSVQSITALAPAGLWLKPRTHRNFQLSVNRYLALITSFQIRKLINLKIMRRIGFSSVSPRWQSLSVETCLDAALAMKAATGYFEIWDATLGYRFEKQITEKIPVTIIFGDSDKTLPAKDSQVRSLAPKHSEWIILNNTGHAPMWDNVDLVVRYLMKTVARA